jgi:hypothetical protein
MQKLNNALLVTRVRNEIEVLKEAERGPYVH